MATDATKTKRLPPKRVQEAGPRATGKEVAISSLGTLQLFMYQGRTYTKRRPHSGGIRALSQKGDELITLPPGTLVTPAE